MGNSPRYQPPSRGAGKGATGPNASKSKMVTESPWGYGGQQSVGDEGQGYQYVKGMKKVSGPAGNAAKIGRDGGSGMRGSKTSPLRGYP